MDSLRKYSVGKGQTGVKDSWILVLDKGISGRTHGELPEVGKNMV
jgi:hypothetical protein